MIDTTLLLRQVHPSFVQAGYATSQAFRPTPKDECLLSTYDGDQINAVDSWTHYTTVWQLASAGTVAVSMADCEAVSLPSRPDPLGDCPEHAVVDFTSVPDKDCHKKSKKLQACALGRGWLHQAPAAK